MADNYLENKMEEHRRGTYTPSRSASSKARPGFVSVETGVQRILVTGYNEQVLATLARLFVGTGSRIGWMCPDIKRGREVAQQLGIVHLPFDDIDKAIDAFSRSVGSMTMLVELDKDSLTAIYNHDTYVFPYSPTPRYAAFMCLALCAKG